MTWVLSTQWLKLEESQALVTETTIKRQWNQFFHFTIGRQCCRWEIVG
jgi:hypothetical protein